MNDTQIKQFCHGLCKSKQSFFPYVELHASKKKPVLNYMSAKVFLDLAVRDKFSKVYKIVVLKVAKHFVLTTKSISD